MDEYAADGYKLTLRQLYYQLVSRTVIENNPASYNRLGVLVSNARLAGLVDWAMIEDQGPRDRVAGSLGRTVRHNRPGRPNSSESTNGRTSRTTSKSWSRSRPWKASSCRSCAELDIRFSANKGYSSSSAMYEAGQRIAEAVESGKQAFILYLGDHDPSGLDMTRDVNERARLFSRGPVEVRRLALNLDQVEAMNLPENTAKLTDKRAAAYIAKYGSSSWELDAIEPRRLIALVKAEVNGLRDLSLWEVAVGEEIEMQTELQSLAAEIRR